jgi:hypothetical protein
MECASCAPEIMRAMVYQADFSGKAVTLARGVTGL